MTTFDLDNPYAGWDPYDGHDYNVNPWVFGGGGTGLYWSSRGTLRTGTLRGPASRIGASDAYTRLFTRDPLEVPFEVEGEILIRERLDDVLTYGDNYRPHWEWGINFHPVFADEDNNVVTGVLPSKDHWTASGQIDKTYGIPRQYIKVANVNHDDLLDWQWHHFKLVVPRVGEHLVWFDGQLAYHVIEKDPPAKWWPRKLFAGMRLDFYDFELRNLSPSAVERKEPMPYRIMPRTEAGLPAAVTGSTGALRPPLWNERWMTAHYTGNNIDYTGKDAAEVTRLIQQVFYATKPFEYNYVIGQNEDDVIVEFAGKFQAAHSGGENADSFGVLFLLGVGEDPTPLMIDKWRWLRDVLIASGHLRPDVDQRMHYQMPGAATACPGNIRNFWPEFLKPWTAPKPPTPPEPTPVQGDKMLYIAKPTYSGATANTVWLAVFESGNVRRAVNADVKFAQATGVPILDQDSKEQHEYLIAKFDV